jgi:hypothetical protein
MKISFELKASKNMDKNIPKYLIEEINNHIAKHLKLSQNIYGRIDIDINTKQLNIFKENGINGLLKENKHFDKLIRIKIRRFQEGDIYTFKDLQVKVRSYKAISFVKEKHNMETIIKPYTLLSLRFLRVSDVELI